MHQTHHKQLFQLTKCIPLCWGTGFNRYSRRGFQGCQKVFKGHEEVFKGQEEVFKGQEEVFKWQEEAFKGRLEVFQGQEEVFKGQKEAFQGVAGRGLWRLKSFARCIQFC